MADSESVHCPDCGGELNPSTADAEGCPVCGARLGNEKARLAYGAEGDLGTTAEGERVDAEALRSRWPRMEPDALSAELKRTAMEMVLTAPKPIWRHAVVFSFSFLALVFFIAAYGLSNGPYPAAVSRQNDIATMVAGGSVTGEPSSHASPVLPWESVIPYGCCCGSPLLCIVCLCTFLLLVKNGIFNRRNAEFHRAAVERYRKLKADLQKRKAIMNIG
jgi:hypothetical protein